MERHDSFKTIACPSEEIIYKEKNSKFFACAFPITSESEIKSIMAPLRKKHFNAVHFCYAFQIGTTALTFRANDDGEPSNSAGMPIYGQIQSFGLTNVLVVVVRYFGGTKLGVGGLISAYRTAAQMTLETASIVEQTINTHFWVAFDYKNTNRVMRVIKEKKIDIISQNMDDRCEIEIAIRKKKAQLVFEIFDSMFEIEIKRKK